MIAKDDKKIFDDVGLYTKNMRDLNGSISLIVIGTNVEIVDTVEVGSLEVIRGNIFGISRTHNLWTCGLELLQNLYVSKNLEMIRDAILTYYDFEKLVRELDEHLFLYMLRLERSGYTIKLGLNSLLFFSGFPNELGATTVQVTRDEITDQWMIVYDNSDSTVKLCTTVQLLEELDELIN